MRLPSLGEIIGILATAIVLMNASGKGHLVWQATYEMQQKAAKETVQPWGCPSIFNKRACTQYDSRWYQ